MTQKNQQISLATVILAILIGVIFVAAAVPALFYFPAQRFLLGPDEMAAEILASDLPDRLPDLVAGWILDGTIRLPEVDAEFLSSLDREDYAEIVKLAAPADWLAVQSALAARQAQDYLLGRTDSLTITLDLTAVSQQLSGEALASVAERIVTSWDACTALDLAELALAMADSTSNALPLCQPPDTFRTMTVEAVKPGLQLFAAGLPASVSFEVAKSADAAPALGMVRWIVRLWSWTPWLSLGMAILLLVVLRGSLRRGLLGIGLPLGLAGVIDAGLAFALAALRQNTLTPWVESLLVGRIPAGLDTLAASVVTNVFGRFCLSALVWGAAAFVLGIALVVASRLIRR